MREEKTTSWAEVIEEKQFLLLSYLPMIALSSLGKENFVFGQLFLVGEGNSVYTLQRVVIGIAEEV